MIDLTDPTIANWAPLLDQLEATCTSQVILLDALSLTAGGWIHDFTEQ
jgi:hypothetical protein